MSRVPYTCRDCADPNLTQPRTSFFHSRGRPYGRCKVHYAIRKKRVIPRPSAEKIPNPILIWCHGCREPGPAMDFHDGENYMSHCSDCREHQAVGREIHVLGPLDLVEQHLYPGVPYHNLTPTQRSQAAEAAKFLLQLDKPREDDDVT